ncbi:putative exosome-associated protein [Sphaerosporella brunnea]|uniref:Exosome complex protein n=1 Tax=Sphaerosporella brunnea TaxID=1250544 RepID=A0A5J5FAK7_9PEZI|nr:putative exosome-associated protein [Sphaerosporella brunnea]
MSDQAFDQLDSVDDRLDELSVALEPLLSKSIGEHATTLPVADKARLYVLTTYAIESLLFSYLRLTGQPIKDHAIMRELTRVKQYVAKVKSAEPAAAAPAMSLDKAAAGRFIAAALAGNDKYDEERAATIAREKAGAEAKLKALEEKRRMEGREDDGNDSSGKANREKKKVEAKEEEVEAEAEGKKKKKVVKRSREEKEARRKRKEKRKDIRKKQKSAS